MTHVGVGNDPHLRERLERSVHRGEMHLGVVLADGCRDVLGAQVPVRVEQRADHEPARSGDAAAMRADLVEHGVDLARTHPFSVGMNHACAVRRWPRIRNSARVRVGVMQNHSMEHLELEHLVAGIPHVRQSPSNNGTLELIVARPAEGERDILETGELNFAEGLAGDTWNQRLSKRSAHGGPHLDMQLNIMNARAIALIAQSPERWQLAGDQLYVDLDLSEANLPPGTRLAIGSAVIEITDQPHTGCSQFSARFGAGARQFVNSEVGRELRIRGINAKVICPGTITRQDRITKT